MTSDMRQDARRRIIERTWFLARLNAANRAAVLRQVTRDLFPRLRGGTSAIGRKSVAGLGRERFEPENGRTTGA